MAHIALVLLIGYFVSGTLAVLASPSGDPYTILLYQLLLFVVMQVCYWVGYARGGKV